jgi:hypothetical protein
MERPNSRVAADPQDNSGEQPWNSMVDLRLAPDTPAVPLPQVGGAGRQSSRPLAAFRYQSSEEIVG